MSTHTPPRQRLRLRRPIWVFAVAAFGILSQVAAGGVLVAFGPDALLPLGMMVGGVVVGFAGLWLTQALPDGGNE